MELINSTGLAAVATLSPDPSIEGAHLLVVSAKATFQYSDDGRVDLDTETTLPLWEKDIPIPLGILPNDLPLLAYADDTRCELMLIGAAYGRGAERVSVSIEIGDWSSRIDAWGPHSVLEGQVSSATPFDRLPLTWEQTAGGTIEVWIDPWTAIDVSHPTNPLGAGQDPADAAHRVVAALGAPDGFPRWDLSPRALPRVVRAGDPVHPMPEPFCWAPPPPEVTTTVHRHLESWRATRPNEEVDLEWTSAFRADPSMVFVAAPLGHPVVLEGCTPAGTARFHLPNVRVLADFAVDGRSGTLDLEARRIVLMPEESRFYIVFHTFARLRARAAGGERSLRLRLE